MNTDNRDILLENLSEIYPEHGWIDLDDYSHEIDDNITPSVLNIECLKILKEWIETTYNLRCEYDFPYLDPSDNDRSVSKLLNGFCLKVKDSKIIFIPNQYIDIDSCEIPHEWVDLPRWSGDYYVAVQVDTEARYLHLWGFITHQQLKSKARLDSRFRYYQISSDRMISDLDILWASCELSPARRSADVPSLASVTRTQAQQLIDRVKSARLPNFPRLVLAFNEWGAILNDSDYLNQFLKTNISEVNLTNLNEWVNKYRETIELILNPSPPKMVTRGTPSRTTEQTNVAIAQLVTLMENSTDDNVRWRATEDLWIISPDHPKLPIRSIHNLGIQSDTGTLALMISRLLINNDRYAILVRVYPDYPEIKEIPLPFEVKLETLDENGEIFDNAISKTQDYNIQVSFVADKGDRFSVRVSLNQQKFVEYFVV